MVVVWEVDIIDQVWRCNTDRSIRNFLLLNQPTKVAKGGHLVSLAIPAFERIAGLINRI